MSDQPLLFSCESMLDIHPLHNFKLLFRNLNASPLDHNYITGRIDRLHHQIPKNPQILEIPKNKTKKTQQFQTIKNNNNANEDDDDGDSKSSENNDSRKGPWWMQTKGWLQLLHRGYYCLSFYFFTAVFENTVPS